jgi:hypothetical protein
MAWPERRNRFRGGGRSRGVPADPQPYDPSRPPRPIDPLLEWADRFGGELVRLADYPIADLRGAVAALDRALRAHAAEDAARGRPPLLEEEHRRFLTSIDQLHWHLGIVERDDHGGHRQALGQYLRLVAEAGRRHRADERGTGSPRANAK